MSASAKSKSDRPVVTSALIKAGLRTTFAAPGWQVFYEVGNDTGTRVNRHADAVAIGIWPSTGHAVHGFEVKVSRADWANEMKDPTKSWAIMQFCHRWSLVTPPGLVASDELPENWGLMTFDGSVMRTVKQAPKLAPVAMTPGFVAALVRRAGEADNAVVAAAVQKARNEWTAEMERRRKEQPITDLQLRHLKDRLENAEAMAAKMREAFPGMNEWNFDDYLHAIKAARKSGLAGHFNGVVGLLNTIEDMAEKVRRHYGEAGFELPERRGE